MILIFVYWFVSYDTICHIIHASRVFFRIYWEVEALCIFFHNDPLSSNIETKKPIVKNINKGWNHEGGLHFRDNLVSKISENQLSAELHIFFGRNIYFSVELLLGRKKKRQIERTHNRALDLREEIWSAG